MARNAIVTGGTRGIGAAISQKLKESGCTVAATYAGNDEAAAKFKEETGINVYKWDVGDYEACKAGVAEVESAQGPTDILVNNAGITRDGMFHKIGPEQWSQVIRADLDSVFNMSHQVFPGMRERGFGRIVNISSINGQKGQMGQTNYSAAKAGMIGLHPGAGARRRVQGSDRERGRAGLYRDRYGCGHARGGVEKDHRPDPGWPSRRGRRNRRLRRVPIGRQRRLHHRRRAHGERRTIHRRLNLAGNPGVPGLFR
jgi:acetoacetyl-CoA reductase